MEGNTTQLNPSILDRIGYLFYVVKPEQSSFAHPKQVPSYVKEVIPLFVALILIEYFIVRLKKKKDYNINDGIGSISQGITEQLAHLMTKSFQCLAYMYIYNNWRLIALPWNSAWTWILCAIAVDFFYYWLHRASHEINILWAAHQVHHSSEHYNLTTALRQSMLQDYGTWFFYLPMAFAIPPSMYLVHVQFNLLYQFWIHTEVIESLGPLEYILNTPSHHRVHHGRNRYCIDKNYAGTLIIWDRMFGTFEAENKEVVYGLTHPINSFSPVYVQLCHYMHIFKTVWNSDGFKNKLSVIFKGPGWEPGKPWHGLIEDIPDVQAPAEQYNPYIPSWRTAYALSHFVLVIVAYVQISEHFEEFPRNFLYGMIGFVLLSLVTLGALLDDRVYAPWIELMRCILFILLDYYFLPATHFIKFINTTALTYSTVLLRIWFIGSALVWLFYCIFATGALTLFVHWMKTSIAGLFTDVEKKDN